MRIREHRRVDNTEDFTRWEWGPPEHLAKPFDDLQRAFVEWLKEWSEDSVSNEAHEKSSASGAAVVFEEIAENGYFRLDGGLTDTGLLIQFWGTESFGVIDELDIVEESLSFDDPQHISAHLRRLADAIDAASPPIAPDEAVPT